MKVSMNREKTYKISEQKARDYYAKYKEMSKKYFGKGFDFPILHKEQFMQVVYRVRADLARAGRYSSDIVKQIVELQAYEGKMSYGEARAFRAATKIDEKISNIRRIERDVLVDKYGGVISEFWNAIKNNPQEVKRWNSLLGTSYRTREAYKIISNYFFGSK